jgi:aryl-alcohol dehydrogenase-like predicted oxidoreductase
MTSISSPLNIQGMKVRLGNSGLKVSRIILGTMQYGDKGWQEWVLGEEEAVEHIRAA